MPNASEVAFQSAFVAPHLKSKSLEKKIKTQHISFGLSEFVWMVAIVSKMTFLFSIVKVFKRSYNQSMDPVTLPK